MNTQKVVFVNKELNTRMAGLLRLPDGFDLSKDYPAAVIVNYTGLSEVTGYEPPTYSAVGTSDGIASWRTMQERLATMSEMGIPTEFHSYDGLPHGFGLGTGTVAEGWINDAVAFWEDQMN